MALLGPIQGWCISFPRLPLKLKRTGSAAFLERYTRSSYSGAALVSPPTAVPTIAEVGDRLLLEAPDRPIEIFNVSGNPHVDGMLVLYDRKSRTLINADLFSLYSPFNETFESLIKWLDRTRLPVEWVLGTHHDPLKLEEIRRRFRTR
ncbi:MAG TPA: hypothetical protein VIK49_07545 [Steroidobacteraceae bacterium]